jgi:hypothetical protein
MVVLRCGDFQKFQYYMEVQLVSGSNSGVFENASEDYVFLSCEVG